MEGWTMSEPESEDVVAEAERLLAVSTPGDWAVIAYSGGVASIVAELVARVRELERERDEARAELWYYS
jgi:hypothetical protein